MYMCVYIYIYIHTHSYYICCDMPQKTPPRCEQAEVWLSPYVYIYIYIYTYAVRCEKAEVWLSPSVRCSDSTFWLSSINSG